MKRNLENRLITLLNEFPIVAIIGARQVGKTTLAKQVYPDWRYIDMQKPSDRERILYDPEMFFKDYPQHIILDEAQMHPIIFDVLRGVIDANRQIKGRFIITGSSSPNLLKHLSESLAGRIAILELGTLKANEIAEAPISDFYNWFDTQLINIDRKDLLIHTKPLLRNITDFAWFNGGYPEVVLSTTEASKQNWFEFYEKTYLYRDVASLFPNINKENFQRFLRALAHLSGTILNKAQLARDLEVSEGSIRNYLDIIEGTFLWRSLPSFERTNYKSLIKMPKGYFADSGLLNYLTMMQDIDYLKQHPAMGRYFEGFVLSEIIKGLQTKSIGSWQGYHYRTKHGAEIDLILEGRFGILPIEIKYSVRVDYRRLATLSSFIEESGAPFGILINQAEELTWITPKILQLPVGYI